MHPQPPPGNVLNRCATPAGDCSLTGSNDRIPSPYEVFVERFASSCPSLLPPRFLRRRLRLLPIAHKIGCRKRSKAFCVRPNSHCCHSIPPLSLNQDLQQKRHSTILKSWVRRLYETARNEPNCCVPWIKASQNGMVRRFAVSTRAMASARHTVAKRLISSFVSSVTPSASTLKVQGTSTHHPRSNRSSTLRSRRQACRFLPGDRTLHAACRKLCPEHASSFVVYVNEGNYYAKDHTKDYTVSMVRHPG